MVKNRWIFFLFETNQESISISMYAIIFRFPLLCNAIADMIPEK